jgi:hypothetical protein
MFTITNDGNEVVEWDSETVKHNDPYDYCESLDHEKHTEGSYGGFVDFYAGV